MSWLANGGEAEITQGARVQGEHSIFPGWEVAGTAPTQTPSRYLQQALDADGVSCHHTREGLKLL